MSAFIEKIADAVAKLAIQEYPSAAKPTDGVSLAATLRQVFAEAGILIVKKTITSSNIKFESAIDVTGISSGGQLQLIDVIVKTNSTGLAGGTNFQILSNNVNGLANIFVETVANLGANKTMDLNGASVTGIQTVLESGKKLQVKNTAANGTGAGTIDIYIVLRRLAADATISAA